MILISLVGEQPLPILLPALHLKPGNHILVHTRLTQPVAKRLRSVLGKTKCHMLEADQHDIEGIAFEINSLIQRIRSEQGSQDIRQEIVLNPTGAKKPMAFGMLAQALRGEDRFVYLESEKRTSKLYTYQVSGGRFRMEDAIELGELLTLDIYLKSFVPDYKTRKVKPGNINPFETAVEEVLKASEFEYLPRVSPAGVSGKLEIDFVVRVGNQVGILELKSGKNSPKEGLDQLAMAGGRAYLGIYTAKFLVVTQQLAEKLQELESLAEARHIHTIVIPDYIPGQPLSDESRRLLLDTLGKNLS